MSKSSFRQTAFVSSLLILLPAMVGLFLYNQLPSKIATHFGPTDVPNGFSSKLWVVVGMPLAMFLLQCVMLWSFKHESKTKSLNFKIVGITFWLLPVIVNIINLSLYAVVLGYHLRLSAGLSIFLGLLFIIFGNYLPKIRPNHSVGIRIPWTLENKVNWQKTHHLAGWTFILAGLMLIISSVFHSAGLVIALLLGALVVPVAYSYLLSKHGY